MSSQVVFVTNQFGAKVLYDDKGLIGKFSNSNNNIMVGDDGIPRRNSKVPELWYMVLHNEELIERARKYPGFGKMFNETNEQPVWQTLGNLRTLQDPSSANAQTQKKSSPIEADAKAIAEKESAEFKKSMVAKSRRYGELFSLVCKAGGDIRKDADQVLVAEFKLLQEELGITEKVNQEETVEAE